MSSNSILLGYSQIMPSKQLQNLTVSILIPHHHFPLCFSDLTCFDTQADASCIRVISVIAVSTVETGTAGSHGSRTSQMCEDENYVMEPRRGHEDFFFFLLRDPEILLRDLARKRHRGKMVHALPWERFIVLF